MIYKKKITSLLLVLTLSYVSFGFACSSSRTRQLAKAEDTIAESELRLATFLTEAKASQTLSQADITAMKPFLQAINEGNKNAISITKELLANPTADKQTELLAAVAIISANITRLNNEGVLRIKDPTKRLAFTGLVVALQGALSSAVVLLVNE